MRYLIDGYNLAYAMSLLTPGPQPPHRLELVRETLLLKVAGRHGPAGEEVTVVFDASRAKHRSTMPQSFQGVRVLFAQEESADDLIEDVLGREKTPRTLTVVSDDRRLQQSARRRGCPPLGCLDYMELLRAFRAPSPAVSAPELLKPGADPNLDKKHWLETFGDVDNDPKLRDDLDRFS